ncbi:hypothetical protein EV144_101804 [Flavobacterium sp. 270]|nr:hypothetical protein EV144_101804 [Flavobacterium sp. 270]
MEPYIIFKKYYIFSLDIAHLKEENIYLNMFVTKIDIILFSFNH